MRNLTATRKGLIAAILMVGELLAIYFYRGNIENPSIYIVYGTYIIGILWAVIALRYSMEGQKNFKNYFSEGFKCFIVITLIIVIFMWVFYKYDTSFRDEMLKNYRNDLTSQKNYTSNEIDNKVSEAKGQFLIIRTFISILGYLIIGALVTIIVSAFLSQQANKKEELV